MKRKKQLFDSWKVNDLLLQGHQPYRFYLPDGRRLFSTMSTGSFTRLYGLTTSKTNGLAWVELTDAARVTAVTPCPTYLYLDLDQAAIEVGLDTKHETIWPAEAELKIKSVAGSNSWRLVYVASLTAFDIFSPDEMVKAAALCRRATLTLVAFMKMAGLFSDMLLDSSLLSDFFKLER